MPCDYSPADSYDIRIRWTTGLNEGALWFSEIGLLLLDCTVSKTDVARHVASILVDERPPTALGAA